MTTKLSDALEAKLAGLVRVEPDVTHRYEWVRAGGVYGGTRHIGEAHADCEALREQIREIVRAATDEALQSDRSALLEYHAETAGDYQVQRVVSECIRRIRARGAKP